MTYKTEKIKNETRIKETIPCFRSISIFSFLCIIKMIESKIIKKIANIPNKFLCNIQLNKIVSAIIWTMYVPIILVCIPILMTILIHSIMNLIKKNCHQYRDTY